MFLARRFFVRPAVAWTMLNLRLPVPGRLDDRSGLRPHRGQAGQRADRGDDFPAGVLHVVGGLPGRARTTSVWQRGEPTVEQRDSEKVLVWPDLVYIELICMVA